MDIMELYTVHGYNRGRNAAGIYALLQNRTEVTDERVMNHVNFLIGGMVPNSINVEFERGSINACGDSTQIQANMVAFFTCRKTYKVEENDLVPLHLNDQVSRTNVRMVCALPFRSRSRY